MARRKRKIDKPTPEEVAEGERIYAEYKPGTYQLISTDFDASRKRLAKQQKVTLFELTEGLMPVIGFFIGFVAALTRGGKCR